MEPSSSLTPAIHTAHLQICPTCQTIPFANLPSEEEPAYPHHASLSTLEISARTCPLCALFLTNLRAEPGCEKAEEGSGVFLGDFAAEIGRTVGNPIIGHVPSLGRWQSLKCGSDGVLEAIDLAPRQAVSFETVNLAEYGVKKSSPIGSISSSSIKRKEIAGQKRIWVFGNYWLLDQPEKLGGVADYYKLQLLGVGMRISEMPGVHHCKVYKREIRHLRGSDLRVFVDFEDPAALNVPGRIREMYSGGKKAFSRVRRWVQNCNDDHACVKTTDVVLPLRVLELADTSEGKLIRLIETSNQKGKYLALSHCWGKSQIITTTTSTLQSRKRGINFPELPETFQDILQIAIMLGIRYVWIDSLCIIQDSFSDWETQAPLMATIYANAYLTVSAAQASSAKDGCWPRHQLFSYLNWDSACMGTRTNYDQRDLVKVETSTSFRQPSTLYFGSSWMPSSRVDEPRVYKNGNYGEKSDPIALERLGSRGWTLQERLLSPRLLHFGRDQMFWECGKLFTSEDGTRFDPKTFSVDELLTACGNTNEKMDPAPFFSFVDRPVAPNTEFETGKRGWEDVVKDYSRRRLTKKEDKLPALSGLAHVIAAKAGDEYLAGLWKRQVIQHLCWKIERSDVVDVAIQLWDMRIEPDRDINAPGVESAGVVLRDPHTVVERKPVPERAPSWSWASVDAPVTFETLQPERIVAELINHEISLSGKDVMGRVERGWLVVKAPIIPIQRRDPTSSDEKTRKVDSEHPNETLVQIRLPSSGATANSYASFDFDVKFPCSALLLDSATAIILQILPNDQEYRRIGIARFLRTWEQKREVTMKAKVGDVVGDVVYSSHEQPLGPIEKSDERKYVRIV